MTTLEKLTEANIKMLVKMGYSQEEAVTEANRMAKETKKLSKIGFRY